MKQIIGIFNKDFVPLAFLSLEDGKIVVDYLDSGFRDVVDEVIGGIMSQKNGRLSMRREHRDAVGGNIDIFMEDILPVDSMYIFAVAERFGNAGILAAVTFSDLKDLFIELGRKEIATEEKNDLWAEMINLDEEGAGALLSFTTQVRPIAKELEDIDGKWQDFVAKKEVELKNRKI